MVINTRNTLYNVLTVIGSKCSVYNPPKSCSMAGGRYITRQKVDGSDGNHI